MRTQLSLPVQFGGLGIGDNVVIADASHIGDAALVVGQALTFLRAQHATLSDAGAFLSKPPGVSSHHSLCLVGASSIHQALATPALAPDAGANVSAPMWAVELRAAHTRVVDECGDAVLLEDLAEPLASALKLLPSKRSHVARAGCSAAGAEPASALRSAADLQAIPHHSDFPLRSMRKVQETLSQYRIDPHRGAMDPKREFRLHGAAALASEAKQLGISVATLKNLYSARTPTHPHPQLRTDAAALLRLGKDVGVSGSEWEYEGSDEEEDLELSPTTGRVLTAAPERLVKHGTVECGAASCLPCLAEAEAFIITDVDGGQPTCLLYKIPAGMPCRPCKQDAGSHPRSSTPRQPDGRKPRRADGTVDKYGGISNMVSPSMLRVAGMLKDAQARLEREHRNIVRERKKVLADRKAAAMG
eukprot:jgi/Tetstr1/430484/TSEL_020292.t1